MDESVGALFDCERLGEAIEGAIVVSDASGAITLWNPAAGRLFGVILSICFHLGCQVVFGLLGVN
jgi:PAS domain-containing protein